LSSRLRRRLPEANTLAAALLSMPCAEYARAMDLLYGNRFGRSRPKIYIEIERIPTASWRAFTRAAALQRYAHRIEWVLAV
jgi:hypothetical protein